MATKKPTSNTTDTMAANTKPAIEVQEVVAPAKPASIVDTYLGGKYNATQVAKLHNVSVNEVYRQLGQAGVLGGDDNHTTAEEMILTQSDDDGNVFDIKYSTEG